MTEVNFDGLVGPNHNYAGLAFGNLASASHAQQIAYPKLAALQGLKKMYLLHSLGLKQAVLPPQERPRLDILHQLGFNNIQQAFRTAPEIVTAIYSASSMWTANAATVSPSVDSKDQRVHFTPANLVSHFHRSLETKSTAELFKKIFADQNYFVHHDPLPAVSIFGDEGAANHTRFYASNNNQAGIEFFVFGRYAFDQTKIHSQLYPARQTFEASQSIARLHQLDPKKIIFAQQNPAVIDAGVFHNDVIAVGNQNVLIYHEEAFIAAESIMQNIQIALPEFIPIKISNSQLSVAEAVASYLFNSQLVTTPNNKMLLIAPTEARDQERAHACIKKIIADKNNPIESVHFVDCRQSMQNGGGPACLRLRVVLNEEEISAIQPRIFLDELLYQELVAWVNKHYRDELAPDDLLDPNLILEIQTALDQLTQILNLGSVYQFQKILNAR